MRHLTPALPLALLLVLATTQSACLIDQGDFEEGSGVYTRVTRQLSEPFERVVARSGQGVSVSVSVQACACRQLVIQGDDNLVGDVQAEVRDGALTLDMTPGVVVPRHPLRVTVRVPEAEAQSLSVTISQ